MTQKKVAKLFPLCTLFVVDWTFIKKWFPPALSLQRLMVKKSLSSKNFQPSPMTFLGSNHSISAARERDGNMIRQPGEQQIVGKDHANETTKTQG